MLFMVRLWILLSAVLCASGWILSALHELNRVGYLVVLGLSSAMGFWWWQQRPKANSANWRQTFHRLYRRFHHLAPLIFLSLICLAFISGALYPPFTWDALMYRTPRVLHWAAEEQWHWIRTFDTRLNTRGCGFEWLTVPLLLFTKTDRLFFLINLFSYALLPGLIFSVFRQLQILGRVAWWWMWLLPAGWCYALSAGSLGNDSFASIYALAAVSFALRAKRSRKIEDLWLSILAVCLLTGVKQTLIPLVLLWLIAVLPSIRLLFARPFATALILIVGLLISAAPMIYFNLSHDANWAGMPKHPAPGDFFGNLGEVASPGWGLVGNLFCVVIQNLAPPINPFYRNWNEAMHQFLLSPLGQHFVSFEDFCNMSSSSLNEQSAGLGVMICLLLLVSILWVWHQRKAQAAVDSAPAVDLHIRLLYVAPWGLLMLFMAKLGAVEIVRMLAPYYPFLLPIMLISTSHSQLVRKHWWQKLGLLTLFSAVMIMVALPMRPLWPAGMVVTRLQQRYPESQALAKLVSFYSLLEIELSRRNAFHQSLPVNEHRIGYATNCQTLESSLWLPFRRRVERVLPGDTAEALRRQNIHYIVVDVTFLNLVHCTIDQLLARYNARIIDQLVTSDGLANPPQCIFLIQLLGPDKISGRNAQ